MREADSAREQLARSFRYAEDLARARERQADITEQMQARQAADPAGADPSTPVAGELDPQTAEALRLARLAQAHPVEKALHNPAAARPSRTPSTTPSRRPKPHR